MHEFLRQWIYRDQTLTDLLHSALWGPLAALLLWLAFTLARDAARARKHREGGRLKRPELVSPQVSHFPKHSDGTAFDLSGNRLPVVGLAKKHPTHIGRPVEVKPEESPKAVTTALTADDGVDRKITRPEAKQDPEHRLRRRPARKERYFQ